MIESENNLQRYLLGELSEAEMEELERTYFADPQLFDRLTEVEHRLVDQHARGRLLGRTLELFESHYLAHRDRRERAEFAATLTARLNPVTVPSETAPSWWNRWRLAFRGPKLVWAFSALCLILLTGIIWFVIERRHLHQELARSQAQRAGQAEREQQLEKELAAERAWADRLTSELDQAKQSNPSSPTPPAQTGPIIATLIFNISGTRGTQSSQPAKLIIPGAADRARLQLILKDSEYETYTVVIQTAALKQIFKQDGLRARKTLGVTVTVPAHRFATGDYILTLKGVNQQGEPEDVSKSLFHVERK